MDSVANTMLQFLMQVFSFIVNAYIVLLLVRFLLQKLGAGWHNSVSQFIIKLTDKPLIPFRKIIPGVKGYDLSILVFALILQWLIIMLMNWITIDTFPDPLAIVMISIAAIISKFIYLYIYAIIINALISWIPQLQSSSLARIIHTLVEPLLSRIRRIMPLVAGVDLSPIPALIILMLLNILINGLLFQLGTRLL